MLPTDLFLLQACGCHVTSRFRPLAFTLLKAGLQRRRAARRRHENPAHLCQTGEAGLITLVSQVTSGASLRKGHRTQLEWVSDRSHPDKGHLLSETHQQPIKTTFPVTGSVR